MKSKLYLLPILIILSSCSQSSFKLHSSEKMPASAELKSYAIVLDSSVPNSTELKSQLHREMGRKNYFYNPESPDVLVMGSFYNKSIEILSGNTFENYNGEQKLEANKTKTKKNTLLLQIVDANTYDMMWRGFSTSRTLHVKPFQIAYNAGRLLNE